MAQDQLKQIEERLRQIDVEMDRLQEEFEELETAKRVLERMTGKQTVESSKPSPLAAGKPRPSGIPTNFEMVDFVLSSAEKEGKDGLTASELVQAIAARYWPGLVGPQILPGIYAFAKSGRLRKTASGKFKRIKKSEE